MLFKTARRVVVFVIGTTVVLIGIVLLVTPGPAFLVIPAGLAILATEFAWAAWLLKRMKKQAAQMVNSIRGGSGRAARAAPSTARPHNEPGT